MAKNEYTTDEAHSADPGSSNVNTNFLSSVATQDDALKYLQGSNGNVGEELIPYNESLDRSLRRRNDYRTIPLLIACYFVTFLDKTTLNVSQACVRTLLMLAKVFESTLRSWACLRTSSCTAINTQISLQSSMLGLSLVRASFVSLKILTM